MRTQHLSPSSRFLVGVATLLITLQLIAQYTITVDHIYPVDSQKLGDHILNWINIGLSQLWLLALTMLAAWIGQLLQKAFPNPSRSIKNVLIVIAVICLGFYIYGCVVTFWPRWFFGSCLFGAFVIGYLVHIEKITSHDTAELIAIVLSLALVYTTTCLLPRHRWIDYFVLMPFVYYVVLLSNAPFVKQVMGKGWVAPVLIVLSTVSFISALIYVFRVKSWIRLEFLLPLWALIIQPLIVYPVSLLCEKYSCKEKSTDSCHQKEK